VTRSTIEDTISSAVNKIAATANKLPGVVVIHDLRDWSIVWMSDRGLRSLGLSLEEVRNISSREYHARYFNEEDAKDYVPKTVELLERNHPDEVIAFFQQVKFFHESAWNWHLSSLKVLCRDADSKPLLSITISVPIDEMHHMTAKASRLLEENNFFRNHFQQFDTLSKREKEVLRMLALGKTSQETGEILFISSNTVETHRKNIKQKLGTNSYYELCQYARAFDLI
jgi:DNA-binding CsgD family transcriptional regulator